MIELIEYKLTHPFKTMNILLKEHYTHIPILYPAVTRSSYNSQFYIIRLVHELLINSLTV